MKDRLLPAHSRALGSQEIQPILKNYARHAFTCLMGALNKFDGRSTPLNPFLIPFAYEAAAYAFFGSSFPAKQTYSRFIKFDRNFTYMAAGLPRFLFRKNFQVREGFRL